MKVGFGVLVGVFVGVFVGIFVGVDVGKYAGGGVAECLGVGEFAILVEVLTGWAVFVGEGRIITTYVAVGVKLWTEVPIATLVVVSSEGIAVKFGVRIVTVESSGGRVGNAPQEDNNTAKTKDNRIF